jgi:hypothetical protein
VRYIGMSGQLAGLAVPLNAGRAYSVLIAGSNLSAGKFEVGSSSPLIDVISETIDDVDFNENVTAISVTIGIRPETPPGDYSLYIQNNSGVRRYLIGGISVERFEDPLSLFLGSQF